MKKNRKFEEENFFNIIDENEEKSSNITAPHTLTPEEVLETGKKQNTVLKANSALEALKARMTQSAKPKKESEVSGSFTLETDEKDENKTTEKPNSEKKQKTLLDKCSPYFIEEDGTEANLNKEPLYKLQSVADILKSDSEKIVESLSEKYDIFFEDLTPKNEITPPKKEKAEEGNEINQSTEKAKDFKTPSSDKKITVKPENFSSFEDLLVISDIDTPKEDIKKPENDRIHNTATITFTPVNETSGETKINISSQARPIDLTGELANIPDNDYKEETDNVKLEKDDFEDFIPDEELIPEKETGRFLKKFFIKKRNSFVSAIISIFLSLILFLYFIPPIRNFIQSGNYIGPVITSCIALLITAANFDCFKALSKIFAVNSTADISAAFSAITVLIYSVFGIISGESVTEMQILLGIIFSFRALAKFFKASEMLTNIKIALSPNPKNTLKLINDSAVAYTMAENSVEGDALVADTQPANNLTDFMKYSTYGNYIDGKLPFITAISLALSVIIGIACTAYFDGITFGFYAAAAIQCFTALPVAFLIDCLPFYRASKKLGKSGAMILGKAGANSAELANAAVINADRIFPAGSVTLHQMQALSANNLEDTIVRAASLTECLGSTLAPIFKTITGTGNITALPDSDTVKYEDRMGISGWVDNRLLFIGNRTLLEAHGIPVPSLEVDRKILRQGYFPVYVATQDKACALLIIQYNVRDDIAKELRRLTDSGVDLLISSCDPNLTEEMICDYFGLYNDSVKVMTAAGRHVHRNMTAPAKTVSAPAVCGRNYVGIAAVLNCASRIKQSNLLLTVCYILAVVLGTVLFIYSSFAGSGTLIGSGSILLYSLISTVISYLLYLSKRP